MNLNLRQIEIFRAVMTTGSISGAAVLLHVSQPAVSRLLSHAEARLGFRLFERIKGRLYATPEAKLLMREVENVYVGVQRFGELAAELAERRQGLLHIVASPSVGQTLVPKVIARFRRSHAAVRLTFELLAFEHIRERLFDRRADIGVVLLPIEHPNLEVTPLATGALVCICPPGHPLQRRKKVSVADLRSYPLISYRRDTPLGIRAAAMYESLGEPLKAAIEVGSPQNACALVELGVGVAIVDEFSVKSSTVSRCVVLPIEGAPELVANLVHLRYEPLSQLALEFVSALRFELATQGFALVD